MSKEHLQVQERRLLQRLDLNFAFVILALNLIGLINLYSATHGVQTETSRLFWTQLVWLSGGWLIYLGLTVVDYKFFVRNAYTFYVLNLSFLVGVMFVGKKFYGAQRWLDLGFFRYQPSETMKLVLVLVFAKIYSERPANQPLGFKALLLPGAVLGLPFLLTFKQPDLGTALLLVMITGVMLLFVGIKRGVLVTALIAGGLAAPLVWNFGLKPYQKNRVLNFLSPGRDPRGTGYNSIQSKIAVGSGRVLGKGFRKGTQSQLEFLPERHTDFIFSVLSEEHGFIGSITTLGMFGVLLVMGLKIAKRARDKTGALICVGVLCYIFWHVFVNIGMVIGLLPIVGVPLPLLSYGGSSLMTSMVGLGLISSISYRRYLF